MSIVNCQECKKEISDLVTSCPNCGAPQKHSSINSANKVKMSRGTLASLGFILGFILLYVGCGADAHDFVKPSSLIMGVIVGTFFSISFVLIFGRSK